MPATCRRGGRRCRPQAPAPGSWLASGLTEKLTQARGLSGRVSSLSLKQFRGENSGKLWEETTCTPSAYCSRVSHRGHPGIGPPAGSILPSPSLGWAPPAQRGVSLGAPTPALTPAPLSWVVLRGVRPPGAAQEKVSSWEAGSEAPNDSPECKF